MSRENRQAVMVPYELLVRARHIVGDRAAGGRMATKREDAAVVWNDLLTAANRPASDLEQVSRELDEAVRLLGELADGYQTTRATCIEKYEPAEASYRKARAFLNNLDNRNGREP